MKLASLRDGGRDGTLVVVNSGLTHCVRVPDIAGTLQAAIEDWSLAAPALEQIYQALDTGNAARAESFDPKGCASPLPRAYQFADGSAYVNHVELVRKARGAEMPPSFWTDPLMYQGLSDAFLGPSDDIAVADESWGIDFEAEVAVIVDDVPMGVSPDAAGGHIKLLMLVNDVSLRNLIPPELAKGFGFFHGKPASAFSPVAVAPETLGAAWDGARLHGPLLSSVNGAIVGRPDAGTDMTFDFPALIAHAAKTRRLSAGTIIGSGTVSNRDRAAGASCLAELRVLETLDTGEARTPFLKFGDTVRIEMQDAAGRSIFGAIDQTVVRYDIGEVK
ncbi:fumarylacetoacetate hydrolase family protein [Rhodospirillaceae bacterium SYSU D60014]|uniref:fumarylacetoacetate hydrolase family protein n=1 Tax=Virgifigura deserti TaxID=2268457 RepID=UPI000E664710